MAHTLESLYWFVNHTSPTAVQRNDTASDMNYIDLSLFDNGKFIVNEPQTIMWDSVGRNVYPTQDRTKDLLIKFTKAQYLSELADTQFTSFYDTFTSTYGLKTLSNLTCTLKEVWVNAAKQIDTLLITISGVDYAYDASGNPPASLSTDYALCSHVAPNQYSNLSSLPGFSDIMLSFVSGTVILPETALDAHTATITDIIVSPSMSIMKYIGTFTSTPYEWDVNGTEITTMDVNLTLVNQILKGTY